MPHNPHDPFNDRLRQAYEQGKLHSQQSQNHNLDVGMQQSVDQLRQEVAQQINRNAGGVRKLVDQKMAGVDQKLTDLANIAKALSATRSEPFMGGAPGTIRIEDIPGRRVPFTMLVDIAIGANTTSVREASVTVSQEGPFVAVKRMATFQSALEFQVTDQETGNIGRFAGRSFGRYRPVSSAWDVMDSQHNAVADTSTWFWQSVLNMGPGPAPEGVLGQPSNMSSFRTMEFDGRFRVINAGSSYPRQNISVPSSFWSTSINAPWDLGALDFFERGEVLTVEVQPTHTNNPPAGNVDGSCVFPNSPTPGYPFIEGQYDAHEGINTPAGVTIGVATPPDVALRLATADPIARLPDGILTIGWEGYRIIQPVGPAI
jgi:hypothetical protein